MSAKSTRPPLKLNKPLGSQPAKISVLNENMTMLEQENVWLRQELERRASLDSSGKIPGSQMPVLNYIPTSQKGKPNGVASLDGSGKIPSGQMPVLHYIPTSQKGKPNGVAELDAHGQVPEGQLPDFQKPLKGMENQIVGFDAQGNPKPIPRPTPGLLPQVEVRVGMDSTVTATDGVHHLEGKSDHGVCCFELPCYGDWAFAGEQGGRKTGTEWVNVNTVTHYQVELSYFNATLGIHAEAGAVVTARSENQVYTVECVGADCEIRVKQPGLYTVTAELDGCRSSTIQVNVPSGGDGQRYTGTVAWVTLTVAVASGSLVSVSNGGVELTEKSGGEAFFRLPRTGTWTVRAELGDDTAEQRINCMAYQPYSVTMKYARIYGVEWDGTATTKWNRTDRAVVFTDPVPAVGLRDIGSSPFDTLMPWSGMKRVSDPQAGEVVSVPKFWFKWTKTGDKLKLQISDQPTPGFHVSPGHCDRGDGRGERDLIYVGRHHCKSTAMGRPVTKLTRAQHNEAIHKMGNNIWMWDWAAVWTIRMLYLVEFADWDAQKCIGLGCGNNDSLSAVGLTDEMEYHTGTSDLRRDQYGVSCQYRWIEGLWDNCFDWVGGCYMNSNGLNVILDPSKYSDNAGGVLIGKVVAGVSSKFALSDKPGFEWCIYPTEGNGGDHTYMSDDWDGITVAAISVGGYYVHSLYSGMFRTSTNSHTDAMNHTGSRVMKLP